MTTPIVEPPDRRPTGHRAVPVLSEPSLGHYPEFREFLAATFGVDGGPGDAPGLLRVDDRFYELVFVGRTGRPFPAGVEVHALVPGLEPMDETATDSDLWAILTWLVGSVGGEWTADALVTTGRIYRIPATSPEPPPPPDAGPTGEALVFDLYGTLVNPLAVDVELERAMSPSDAQQVAQVWRRTQLEYSFRLTAMGRYQDFAWVTERALQYALRACGRTMSPADAAAALARYDALAPFPDVIPGLTLLATAGHPMALLSNGNPTMLTAALDGSGLRAHLPQVISADTVRAFKPHPAVYRLAADVMHRPIDRVRLVSSNPFDIVGAATAGMRTAWVNRAGVPFDTFDVQPDTTVSSLTELATVLAGMASG